MALFARRQDESQLMPKILVHNFGLFTDFVDIFVEMPESTDRALGTA